MKCSCGRSHKTKTDQERSHSINGGFMKTKRRIECDCHGMEVLCENCGGKGFYMKNKPKYLTTKCVECNSPKLAKLLYCEKHLKAEYARYFDEGTLEKKTEHTPTRCKDCQWVDEADSVKQTSFRGVQLCHRHNLAVNSHEELLHEVKRAQVVEFMVNGTSKRYDEIGGVIARAEGK